MEPTVEKKLEAPPKNIHVGKLVQSNLAEASKNIKTDTSRYESNA